MVVSFIPIRLGSFGPAKGSSVTFTGAAACLGVIGFIKVRVGSLGRALESSGSFGLAWVHWGATRVRPVHSDSRRVTGAGLGGVGFIPVRGGLLGRA